MKNYTKFVILSAFFSECLWCMVIPYLSINANRMLKKNRCEWNYSSQRRRKKRLWINKKNGADRKKNETDTHTRSIKKNIVGNAKWSVTVLHVLKVVCLCGIQSDFCFSRLLFFCFLFSNTKRAYMN